MAAIMAGIPPAWAMATWLSGLSAGSALGFLLVRDSDEGIARGLSEHGLS